MKRIYPQISIIGMACELAGPASSLANFYEVVINGTDATSSISPDRLKVDLQTLPPSILRGGFLKRDPWLFDHAFFSITPKEAARMDPQHRMLLENTYHAFEDANLNIHDFKGKKCGVFIGLATQDYARMMHASGDFPGLHGKGSLGSMAAGRISYHFDFIGPSFVVDTACSSSLVALHQAVQSLQQGECDLAIVGASTLILTIDYSLDLANAGMLAQDGRCKAFSRYADGFARGEGVSVIILERKEEACKARRRIYANLLGSAINCDGESNGITAPSKEAQIRVIKEALGNAMLNPFDVTYIETHGTGTNLGDKIEYSALSQVYQGRATPLYLGSVKSNIAHCEAAAGLAGIIKTSLCIYHGKIPPHAMFDSINPDLHEENFNVIFPSKALDHKNIIASISSFGMSGANACVLLGPSEAEESDAKMQHRSELKVSLPFLLLSAKSAEALVKLGQEYKVLLQGQEIEVLKNTLDYSNLTRRHFPQYRALVYGNNPDEFLERLDTIPLDAIHKVNLRKQPKVTFLFTGQGSHYLNMTKPLYDHVALYRNLFDKYAALLDSELSLPEKISQFIFSEVTPKLPFTESARIEQLSLFLVEFVLAELLTTLGVKPCFVVGHSLGEYAAACSAGILTFSNAIQMVSERSLAIANAREFTQGCMVQALGSKETIETILDELHSQTGKREAWISALNAPEIYVISGTVHQMEQLMGLLKKRRVPHIQLNTRYSFHTPFFNQAAAQFKNTLLERKLTFSDCGQTSPRFISTVFDPESIKDHLVFQDLDYWESQITNPVQFSRAIKTCYQNGSTCFIEVGPDFILGKLAAECLKHLGKERELIFSPMHVKKNQNVEPFFQLLQHLYRHDLFDLTKLPLLCDESKTLFSTSLPLYPFTRTQLIPDYLKSEQVIFKRQTLSLVRSKLETLRMEFEIQLDLDDMSDAYLGQHIIHSNIIVPGSYFLEMALSTIENIISDALKERKPLAIQVKNLTILNPVVFTKTNKITLKMIVERKAIQQYMLTFLNSSDQNALVCELSIVLVTATEKVKNPPVLSGEKQSTVSFYQEYANRGVSYGPAFKMVQSYYALAERKVLGEITLPERSDRQQSFQTWVTFIDNCFHTIALCLDGVEHAYAPVSISEYTCYSRICPEGLMRCYAEIIAETSEKIEANLSIYNAQDALVVEMKGVRCQRFDKKPHDILHEVNLHLVQSTPESIQTEESYFLMTDSFDLKRIFSAYKTFSSEMRGVNHLIYAIEGNSKSSDTLFELFSQFYKVLRTQDDQHPGKLKKVSLVSCRNSNLTYFMQAIALVYPTEFPHIAFRSFNYDICTQENLGYLFGELLDLKDPLSLPFWTIQGKALYREQISSLKSLKAPLHNVMNIKDYYLITGGLGGIGRELIGHMVMNLGIKNLIITIRSFDSLSQEKRVFLEMLKSEYGANILCKALDLTVESQVVELFKEIPRPLCGIFHLAGINIDLPLGKITSELMDPVLKTKLHTAWKLHELSLKLEELQYFVLFSSMAAKISSPGQFSYTLANLGLEELGRYRADLGLPITVIDWGPWKEIGMMTRLSQSSHSKALDDFEALEPTPCLEALFKVIAEPNQHHFAVFKQSKKSSFIEAKHASPKVQALLTPFSNINDSIEFIKNSLITLISQETSYPPSEIKEDSFLNELGIDSINTIRIRAELQTMLNLQIPMAILLDTPSVSSIAEQLADLWMKERGGSLMETIVNGNEHAAPQDKKEDHFYPLSHNQFSIWYEQQSIEGNTAYHCSLGWKISGAPIHLEKLQQAFESALQTQEMLRAVITEREGAIGYKLLSLEEALSQQAIFVEALNDNIELHGQISQKLNYKIDFYKELPTRLFIFHHRRSVYFIVASHHIIMDATSIFILGENLLRSLCATHEIEVLPQNAATYHDFVKHQGLQTDQFIKNASDFLFKQAFDEENELLHFELPHKTRLKGDNIAQGGSVRVQLNVDEKQNLMKVPLNWRAPLCLSAWGLLLSRYTGEDCIQIGMAFNGRTQAKWSNTIGHFINVLPLQLPINQQDNGIQYLTHVRNRLLQLVDFQEFPLSKFLAHDKVKNALHHGNLFQTYFNYFDASKVNIEIDNPSLEIEPYIPAQQEAQFEISLWVTREPEHYVFDVKYRSDLLAEDFVNQLADHYRHILLSLSTMLLKNDLVSKLKDIQLLSKDDEKRLLQTELKTSSHAALVYDYFLENARKNPAAIAIEMKDRKVTYQELHECIEELASRLPLPPQMQPDQTVAILTSEKANIEFIIVVLYLWKLGYAYLPLNTRHPLERIKYMLETVGCKTILNIDTEISSQLSNLVSTLEDSQFFEIRLAGSDLKLKNIKNDLKPFNQAIANDSQSRLAYVLFTSGSTGMPKGVMVEHQGLIDRLLWMKDYFKFSSSDKFLQSTVLTFDISLPEFCLPLICGGTSVLFHPEDNHNAHAQVCMRHQVTMMSTVPSLFSILQEDLSVCSSLRHIILVGEIVAPATVNEWLQSPSKATLYNLYGPTEATIYATYYACRTPIESSSSVPIGFACKNVIPLVLDAYGNLVPKGVPGELYLSGEGIARGYLGQTKTNPFANNPYQALYPRLYKTGDFVRWLNDGSLEYLGRKDNRIKLHGLLIELSEIEQLVLKAFPTIKNAAALIVELSLGSGKSKQIVLCVNSLIVDTHVILEYLRAHLPQYMLPWQIFVYSDFPRNSSNKIDRKALQNLVQKTYQEKSLSSEVKTFEEVKISLTPLEAECVQIWKTLLQREKIPLDASFFDLGGDSLLVTKMILLVEKRLALKINFAKFLLNPTINAMLNGMNQQSISWDQELKITDNILLFPRRKAANGVFLTGVTGHLGIHLLHELLEYSDSEISLVIRSDSKDHARERLCARYQEIFSNSLNLSRIRIYPGDLSHPTFTLEEEVYSELCQNISVIIHAAAEVNHAVDYARLKAGNVIATQNVLKLSQLAHCSKILYISTQFSEINHLPEEYLESEFIRDLSSGYEQSKFVTELQMKSACERGYPVTTLRLPLIFDGLDPTLLTQNHFVSFVIKCLKLGFYPDSESSFDILPTKEVAQFIVRLSNEKSSQSVYNCLEHSLKLSDLFDHFKNQSAFKLTKLDYPAWRDLVIQSTDIQDPFYRLLPLYTTEASPLHAGNQRKVHNHTYLKAIGFNDAFTETKYIEKMAELLFKTYRQSA